MKRKGDSMKSNHTINKNNKDMQAKHAEIKHKIEIISEAFDYYQEAIRVKTPIWSELY